MANKQLDHRGYLQYLKVKNARDATRISLCGEYIGRNTDAKHRCDDCGHLWHTRPSNMMNGRRSCPACWTGPTHQAKISRGLAQLAKYRAQGAKARPGVTLVALDLEEVTSPLDRVRLGASFTYVVRASCDVCGFHWSPGLHNFLRGVSGCPKCAGVSMGGLRHSTESLRQSIMAHQANIDVSAATYTGADSYVRLSCPDHGAFLIKGAVLNAKLARPNSLVCGRCGDAASRAKYNQSFTQDWFMSRLAQRHADLTECAATDYQGMHSPLVLRCAIHGEVGRKCAQTFLFTGCPRCSANVTRPHRKVLELLDRLGIDYLVNDRTVIRPLELDIFVPSRNLGIEINGFFWHSDKPTAHKDKLLRCRAQGVRLIQLWDTEIYESWPKVESLLVQILGKSVRLGARKLEIRQVSNEVAYRFFDLHHMQGHRRQTRQATNLALVQDRKIYQVLSLDRPLFSKTHDLEITRLATRAGYSISGGAQRLFAHFRRQFGPKYVVSYCDQRLFTGHVYETLGFTRVRWSKPNYWYVNAYEVLSRYQCQKHKLEDFLEDFDPNLSEYANMQANRYLRVYDCGSVTYEIST